MLWFSERTWVHHYVSFILTLCAAGAILSDPAQPERTRRRRSRRALIVFSFATCFASEAGRMLGPDGVDWAKGVGVFLWPSLLVTIAVIRPWNERPIARRRPDPPAAFRVLFLRRHPHAFRAAGRIGRRSTCFLVAHRSPSANQECGRSSLPNSGSTAGS